MGKGRLRMRYSGFKKRFLSLIITLCFLVSCFTPVGIAEKAVAEASSSSYTAYTASELAEKAVQFIYDQYQAGEEIDPYAAYVLTLAGEDLAGVREPQKWIKDNQPLKNQIEKQADLLGNENTLITYLLATQNSNGSFGPLANDYGTRVPLQALALVKTELVELSRENSDYPVIFHSVQRGIDQAVAYFKNRYLDGRLTYAVDGFDFDYRCVEALVNSGIELKAWVYEGKSLSEIVIASAEAAAEEVAHKPGARDAVYLAKEIIALNAVAPDSNKLPILAKAVINQQNIAGETLSFGQSIYDQVLVLTALGKIGQLNYIDQEKAFNYLETFKHEHQNAWGQAWGTAWGGYFPEESDLTAQVLTALSYFEGARIQNSTVAQAIEGGLVYLGDIQEVETGAIPAQWDSTFSTAETLIALKALGKTYTDYAGSSSWVKKSKTKTIAQYLLALNQWYSLAINDKQAEEAKRLKTRVDRLVDLLINRHTLQGFENSVYSDMWAYLALGEAGQLGSIAAETRNYLLNKQHLVGDALGSWGDTFDQYYADFMSTAQAIRALSYLADGSDHDPQLQNAIAQGLGYLKKQQQPDGSVYTTQPYPDDPVVDTAEVIITLIKLGQDPLTWENEQGHTPVSYLLLEALNGDGSFGPCRNVLDATEALYAYHLLGLTAVKPGASPSSGSSSSQEQTQVVKMAIVGREGELLYRPGSITVRQDSQWGLTALGALAATGLDYVESKGLVKSIAGQANAGMKGWMYQVNGTAPMVSAANYQIRPGDQIIWWYSTDINTPGPTWSQVLDNKIEVKPEVIQPTGTISTALKEQNLRFPAALRAGESALTAMEQMESSFKGTKTKTLESLGEEESAVLVAGNQTLGRAAKIDLRKEFSQNTVALKEKVEAKVGAIINDRRAEIALAIPAQALDQDVEVTLKKVTRDALADNKEGAIALKVPSGYQRVSPVYQWGPEGVVLERPVTLNLRIGLPWFALPKNLVLAQYNRSLQQWVAIPAVFDPSQGLVLARLNRIDDFIVLAREEKKAFVDISETTFSWAQETIEKMAGVGMIAGVDGMHFEPSRAVTRAEIAALLVNALEPKGGIAVPENQFIDVKPDDWYTSAVNTAAAAGLIRGYEDGTFRPNQIISRQELAVMLMRTLDQPVMEAKLAFADAEGIVSWARNSVAYATELGLLNGFPDGTFRAQDPSNRAEAAVVVYRLLMFVE